MDGKSYAEKIAELAKNLTSKEGKAQSGKGMALEAIKAQKSKFKTALKNGYTRKELLERINKECGVKISARAFSEIIGKRKKSIAKTA